MIKNDNPQLYDDVIYTISKTLDKEQKNPTFKVISEELGVDINKIEKVVKDLEGNGYLYTKPYLNHHELTEDGKNFILTDSSFVNIIQELSQKKLLRENQDNFFSSSLAKLELEIQELKKRLSEEYERAEVKKNKEQSDFFTSTTTKNRHSTVISYVALILSVISLAISFFL